MNIALLTAAGIGSRMGQDIPKQFIHIDDKPVIIHTLEAFQNHPSIDAIIVVSLANWKDVLWAYAKQFNITKLKWVVDGGNSGQESIRNGIEKLNTECNPEDVVLIHDGNRCLVSGEIISDSLATYAKYGSAVAVIPCVEAVFVSAEGQSAVDTIPRETLFRTQTPHTYKISDVLDAHILAQKKGISNTAATCSLMYELGKTVYFSKGSEENIKITTVEDMRIFKALKNTRKEEWIK